MSGRVAVEIALYRCREDGKLLLVLEHPDGTGLRISGHKPAGCDKVEAFLCEIGPEDLKEYERPRQ